MKKVSLGVVIVLGLGCSSIVLAGGPDLGKPAATMITKAQHFKTFDRIKAAGYFKLHVTSRGISNGNQVTITRDAPQSIIAAVRGRTLYITSRYEPLKDYKEPQVYVRVPSLKGITVAGPTGVVGKGIESDGLTIKSNGYGTLSFSDTPQIEQITQIRNNVLNARDIDNDTLTVYETGFGKINLRGSVDHLYARVFDESTFNAKKLPATHIFVQAKDESIAYVSPKKSLRAFATQSANIYYYKYLKNLTRYSVQSGNVFQMKW